jgi:hypothetical protein
MKTRRNTRHMFLRKKFNHNEKIREKEKYKTSSSKKKNIESFFSVSITLPVTISNKGSIFSLLRSGVEDFKV